MSSTPSKPTKSSPKSRLTRQRGTKNAEQLAQIARLVALEARQSELDARIAHLEREVHRNFPNPWVTPTGPYPPAPPVLPTPQDDINDARCHVCNNRFKDMTHYVCNNDRCPNRVWCGDTTQPVFTCGGASSSATVDTLTLPKPGVGPYGSPGTISIPVNGGRFGDNSPSHFAGATIHAVGQTPKEGAK